MKTDLSHVPANARLSPVAKLLGYEPGAGTTLIEDTGHEVPFIGKTFVVADSDGPHPAVLGGFIPTASGPALSLVDMKDGGSVILSVKQYAAIAALVRAFDAIALKDKLNEIRERVGAVEQGA